MILICKNRLERQDILEAGFKKQTTRVQSVAFTTRKFSMPTTVSKTYETTYVIESSNLGEETHPKPNAQGIQMKACEATEDEPTKTVTSQTDLSIQEIDKNLSNHDISDNSAVTQTV